MSTKLLLITSIVVVGLLRSTASAADNRFDGIWVGTESIMMQEFHGTVHSEPFAQKKPAKIVIAQNGTLLGVLEGYGPGRYEDVRRVGNTIVFHAGVRIGQLSLSPDGQTMLEKGRVQGALIMGAGQREGALSGHQQNYQSHDIPGLAKSTTEVTGTFHRQK